MGSATGHDPEIGPELAPLIEEAAPEVEALAADSATASRGMSDLGGIFSSDLNAEGGQVWTSEGAVNQNDVANVVNSVLYNDQEINILTGVHGGPDGTMIADANMYLDDVTVFRNLPGVNVYNIMEMTDAEISSVLNSPGTTIGAFCNSGACLAPYW